jgi:hypothetical protein
MAFVLPNGRNQFMSVTGAPLAGGKVYTYVAGTSTPKSTYTTSAGTVANANPIVLNARGEAAIYWNGVYDVTLKDSNNVLIWGPERLDSDIGPDRVTQSFVSTAGQTAYTLSSAVAYADVFMNGIRLKSTDWTLTTSTLVTLAVAAVVSDEIEVVGAAA